MKTNTVFYDKVKKLFTIKCACCEQNFKSPLKRPCCEMLACQQWLKVAVSKEKNNSESQVRRREEMAGVKPIKKSGRKCQSCGKDAGPNWFMCPNCREIKLRHITSINGALPDMGY